MANLREATNNVEVIGTVKKVDLEEKKSKTGKDMIIGSVIIEVKEENKVHNIKLKTFSMKLNKAGEVSGLFKGYKKVKDEYQVGDRVRATGSITLQEYYGQDGSLKSFNEIKALFFNRLEGDEANVPDRAIATVEMVIEGMTSEIENDVPTGNLIVDSFTVDYFGNIVVLHGLKIGEELGAQFQGLYFPGSTGKITFKINNYAEVSKEEIKTENVAGFGSQEKVEENIVTNYTSEFLITGGDLPYNDGVNEYTAEEIEQAHKNRELALQQLQQDASPSVTPTTGFGQPAAGAEASKDDLTAAFTGGNTNTVSNGDIPAF